MKFKRPCSGASSAGEAQSSREPHPKSKLDVGCVVALYPELGDVEAILLAEVLAIDGEDIRVRALTDVYHDAMVRVITRGDELRVARDCACETTWAWV